MAGSLQTVGATGTARPMLILLDTAAIQPYP